MRKVTTGVCLGLWVAVALSARADDMKKSVAKPIAQKAAIAPTPRTLVLKTLVGDSVSPLTLTKEEKVRVLVFVAHDCPISNKYAPTINTMIHEYAPKNVSFYLVYTESDLKPADARKHAKEFGYTCPALLDPKHLLSKTLGAKVTPEVFVIGKDGKTLYQGRIDDRFVDFGKERHRPTVTDLRNALDNTLVGKPISPKVTRSVGCYIPD